VSCLGRAEVRMALCQERMGTRKNSILRNEQRLRLREKLQPQKLIHWKKKERLIPHRSKGSQHRC
jgi:hypothetical protein